MLFKKYRLLVTSLFLPRSQHLFILDGDTSIVVISLNMHASRAVACTGKMKNTRSAAKEMWKGKGVVKSLRNSFSDLAGLYHAVVSGDGNGYQVKHRDHCQAEWKQDVQ